MSDGTLAMSATLPRFSSPRSVRKTVAPQYSQTLATDDPARNSIGAPQLGQLPLPIAIGAQLIRRVRPFQNGSRSSRFKTFIAPESGSGSARNSTDFGTLYPAMFSRQCP